MPVKKMLDRRNIIAQIYCKFLKKQIILNTYPQKMLGHHFAMLNVQSCDINGKSHATLIIRLTDSFFFRNFAPPAHARG